MSTRALSLAGLLAVAVALAVWQAVALAGCAARGTPHRQIAASGITVLEAVDAVAEQAQDLHARQLMPTASYRAVLERTLEAHDLAVKLADVLLAISEGREGLATAQRLIDQLRALAPQYRAGLDGEALDAITDAVSRLEAALARVNERLTGEEPPPESSRRAEGQVAA